MGLRWRTLRPELGLRQVGGVNDEINDSILSKPPGGAPHCSERTRKISGKRREYVGLLRSLVGRWKSRRREHATTMPTIKTFDFYRKIPLDLTETTLQGAVMSGCAL